MKKILKLIPIFIFAFAFVFQAQAARLFFETETAEVGVGQEMEVTLRLDTEGETINAIEGEVHLPEIILAESIRDGNSMIALWAEPPEISDGKTIIFSGIIPGGRKISDGEVFSFIAKTNKAGIGTITLSGARVLLHDGKGTETETRTETLALRADKAIPLTDFLVEADLEPPEEFKLYLADDPNVFSGDYFLAFASQDKGLGIDYYEVLETKERLADERLGEWQVVKSPYRIEDQTLKSFVYIRVVDRAGNIRVSVFEPSEDLVKPIRINYKIIASVFLVILVLIVVVVYRRRRKY